MHHRVQQLLLCQLNDCPPQTTLLRFLGLAALHFPTENRIITERACNTTPGTGLVIPRLLQSCPMWPSYLHD